MKSAPNSTSTPARFSRAHEAQLQFLRLSAQLEESLTPNFVRRTTFILSMLVLLFIGWIAIAPVEEITQAPGEVTAYGPTQIVQHSDGGIVKEIQVHEGSFVKEGGVLLQLDGADTEQELTKAVAALDGIRTQLKPAEELFQIQHELKAKGATSNVRYLTSQQSYLRIKRDLAEQEEVVRRMQERVRRLVVTAPVSGVIKRLKVNAVGGMVKPGEPLMEIEPTNNKLVVEARLSPADARNVTPGQAAKVKVSAFDYGRFGAVDGVLEFVTATPVVEVNGNKYHRARIILDQDHANSRAERKIVPGMTVQASIVTGKTTILAHLIMPGQQTQRAVNDGNRER